jgi:ribosomal protein L11 methyltransferase
MPFLQFSLDIGTRDPEPYEEALFELGALSVTLLDAADDPVLEPAPGAMPLWPTVVVRAMFPADADPGELDQALRARAELDAFSERQAQYEPVADRPWEREWLKDFRPLRFGRRLWVCPGGQRPADDATPDEPTDDDRPAVVELDPGLAFGTGTHATTALCLEWLDGGAAQGWLRDALVVDYGCGSGILAIAALKLGARRAHALDIDPQAVRASRENAARNEVSDRIQTTDDPALQGIEADVLVANILAGPLVELAPQLARLVRAGGRIGLSGILLDQTDAVTDAYEPWFDITQTGARDGWGLLTGCRREERRPGRQHE